MNSALARVPFIVTLLLGAACSSTVARDESVDAPLGEQAFRPKLGAHYDASGANLAFAVHSAHATRIVVDVHDRPSGAAAVARFELTRDPATNVWSGSVPVSALRQRGVGDTVYYGYRAWGPNWVYDASWTPGSEAGFVADVDAEGHRFNPNKLLLDPYALEMSHDPIFVGNRDGHVYASGPVGRALDSGPVAPKGIVIAPARLDGPRPTRALKDDIVYEAHVRGLTMNDPTVPEGERGTYAGAARKAAYLKSIGVTAIEFLPLHETQNDANDLEQGTDGDNYWGYMSLSYFAPDRRYARDKSPGGPTREFQAMVRAFHEADIKVYVDVVYNHTGEGGLWDATGNVANLLSWRGLDNTTYYQLTEDRRFSYDNTGVGGNFNTANAVARDMILDSLAHWSGVLGADGFRFDLAVVLGNACDVGCFRFDKFAPDNALNRAVRELPVRPEGGGAGVDLIAEPWAIGDGTYQVGNFPAGWAEWNGDFRDSFRNAQNKAGFESVTPGKMAARLSGSPDFYQDDGRRPWHSVNFMAAHDGFPLRDVYTYNEKRNDRPWPYGPSDGGESNNHSWDQGGDPAAQRQAARTGLALVMVSAGVPMLNAGDEMYRTQYGNNNAYNLDSPKNWLDWTDADTHRPFFDFSRRLMAFRHAHPALRPAHFFTGADHDGNGLKDIAWYAPGGEADSGYFGDANHRFLAFRVDGAEAGDTAASIFVAYNGAAAPVSVSLPANLPGKRWYRAGDTAAWMEPEGNFAEPGREEGLASQYDMAARSLLVLLER